MPEPSRLIEFGPFRVDLSRRLLLNDGQPVPLSGKALEILAVLVQRAGALVTKDELIAAVWPDTIVEEGNLTVHISAVRKALGERPSERREHRYILTVAGRGYQFVAPVRDVTESAPVAEPLSPPSALPSPLTPSEVSADSPRVVAPEASSARRNLRLIVGAVAAAVVIAIVVFGPRWWHPAAPPVRSLAILPFRALGPSASSGHTSPASPASEEDYFGPGLADAIITKLSSIGDVIVRPTSDVMRFAAPSPDLQTIGRALDVDAVLDGSVQRTTDRIRVSVRLIRVANGEPLWAATFDDQLTNLFALEDSLSQQVAGQLHVKLTEAGRASLTRHSTSDVDAYDAYLKGRFYCGKLTEDAFAKAIEQYHHAIDRDPAFALAYAGLADCYYNASNLRLPPREAMPKAKAAATQAVALDPNLAEAHTSLGLVASKFDWEWDVAGHEFEQALALNPNSAPAHQWYGLYLASIGRVDHALAELERAETIDPLSVEITSYRGTVLYWARRYDQALERQRAALEVDATYFPTHVSMGWALDMQGKFSDALDEFTRARQLDDNPWTLLAYARGLALAGQIPNATLALDQLFASKPPFVSAYDLATVYAAMGRKTDALTWLNRAFDDKAEWMSYLKVDPALDSLRAEPAFQDLLKRMGLDK